MRSRYVKVQWLYAQWTLCRIDLGPNGQIFDSSVYYFKFQETKLSNSDNWIDLPSCSHVVCMTDCAVFRSFRRSSSEIQSNNTRRFWCHWLKLVWLNISHCLRKMVGLLPNSASDYILGYKWRHIENLRKVTLAESDGQMAMANERTMDRGF